MLLMTTASPPVRVRFAPSPTGELHVGGARTALYEFLFARHHGGEVFLRVEDTDQKRYVPGSMDRFLEDLTWLGIAFDGEPIIQSSRMERHREVARQLVAVGAAYFEPSIDGSHGQKRGAEEYRSGRAVYRGQNRDLRDEPSGPHVVRLKVPDGTTVLGDLVRGRIEFDLATVDDQVLLKSDGSPTYHLAAMVDDHDLDISHIIRSEEWLPSTPKHLLIFQAMGWAAPQFAHLPVILAPDGKKLSKRLHGESVWVRSYRNRGYLPEALDNYLALLGWNPGGDREFMAMDELVAAFSLERVHKAGAKFDEAKLDAFQAHYVRALSTDELVVRLARYLEDQGLKQPAEPSFGRMVSVVHDRLTKFADFPMLTHYFTELPDYPAGRLVFKRSTLEATVRGLVTATTGLTQLADDHWSSLETLSDCLASAVAAHGLTNGDLFWPVRVALSGENQSANPAECLFVLGRAESLRRLAIARQKLASLPA